MLEWTAFGLYCLIAVMMASTLIAEAKNGIDIDDGLRPSLYVLLVITAAGWPVSLACVAAIRLGRRAAQSKTK